MTESSDEIYHLSPFMMNELAEEIEDVASLIPEVNFLGFSTYTILLAEVCASISVILPQSAMAVDDWGRIDASCMIVSGIGQIMQAKSAPIANRVKGATSILSGAQLYWLISIGLGPIGFASAICVSFIHSLYDTAKTLRRIEDIDYWYKDTQNELDYLKTESENIENSIAYLKKQLEISPKTREKKIFNWLIDRRYRRKKEIDSQIEQLNSLLQTKDFDSDKKFALQEEMLGNLYNNLMFGTALVSVLLFFIPGAQIPASLLVTVAVSLFVYKNVPKIGEFFVAVVDYVNFNSKGKDSNDGMQDIIADEEDGEGESIGRPHTH